MGFSVRSSFLAVLLSISSFSTLVAGVTLQAGAFQTREEAAERAQQLESTGYTPILIQAEESAQKGLMHKVLIGSFGSRGDADAAKSDLKSKGINTFIRTSASYDVSAVRAAITGTSETAYFKTPASNITSGDETSLTLVAQGSELKSLLNESTTSPETLKQYTAFIKSVPDSNPVKAKDIIMLGHYSFSGKSAYSGQNYDLSESRGLLLQVANGEIASDTEDQIQAQEMIAHQLHYYTRDYAAALSAYRQILDYHLTNGNPGRAAKIRSEIAGSTYELAKSSGFDRGEVQVVIEQHWSDATVYQQPYISGDTEVAKQVRNYTFRIGLMLTEILMEQKKWEQAKQISLSLTQMYRDLPECYGLLAEAYCHLAKVGLNLRDKDLCYSSIADAIRYGQIAGKTWGDPNRDPVWKAYALKNAGAFYFEEEQEIRDQIKQEMYTKFPGHPGLKMYFGEED